MTPAIKLLQRTKTPHRILEYDHAPDADGYGLEAARVLNQAPEQVFKTLLAQAPSNELIVAMVPVSCLLDLKALAGAANVKKATMADPAYAERSTGYVVGGISPLGQKRRLRAFLDASALAYEEIYVSAGRRGLEIALTPNDLLALAQATSASIAKRG
ncbi:MAG: Cys-tRNA(Pro) deacylase [Gammaproteobacteria bacterium]|nr:Cys-tRNA(Pro) deacylase [Gammaproteobacteria bacterium]